MYLAGWGVWPWRQSLGQRCKSSPGFNQVTNQKKKDDMSVSLELLLDAYRELCLFCLFERSIYIKSRYHLYPFALVQSKDYALSPVLGVLDTFHLLKYLDVPGEPVSSQEVGEQGKPVTKRNEESENE